MSTEAAPPGDDTVKTESCDKKAAMDPCDEKVVVEPCDEKAVTEPCDEKPTTPDETANAYPSKAKFILLIIS